MDGDAAAIGAMPVLDGEVVDGEGEVRFKVQDCARLIISQNNLTIEGVIGTSPTLDGTAVQHEAKRERYPQCVPAPKAQQK